MTAEGSHLMTKFMSPRTAIIMNNYEITPEMAVRFIMTHKQVFLIIGAVLILFPIYVTLKRYKGSMRIRMRRKAAKYILPGLISSMLPFITSYITKMGMPEERTEYIIPALLFAIATAFFLFF